jgi:hypothetical protein
MSTREIQEHLRELYGIEVSPDLVSAVTDAVLDEVAEWQNRPLEALYPLVITRRPSRPPGRAARCPSARSAATSSSTTSTEQKAARTGRRPGVSARARSVISPVFPATPQREERQSYRPRVGETSQDPRPNEHALSLVASTA